VFKAVIALSLLLGILAGVAAFIRKMLRDKALHEERMAQLVREDYQDRYMASIADTSLSLRGAAQLRVDNDDDGYHETFGTEVESTPKEFDNGVVLGNLSHQLSGDDRGVLAHMMMYAKHSK
jgi:hypothetical protein